MVYLVSIYHIHLPLVNSILLLTPSYMSVPFQLIFSRFIIYGASYCSHTCTHAHPHPCPCRRRDVVIETQTRTRVCVHTHTGFIPYDSASHPSKPFVFARFIFFRSCCFLTKLHLIIGIVFWNQAFLIAHGKTHKSLLRVRPPLYQNYNSSTLY